MGEITPLIVECALDELCCAGINRFYKPAKMGARVKRERFFPSLGKEPTSTVHAMV